MHRTVVIGICLGLGLASRAAAEQIMSRPAQGQATAKTVSGQESFTRTGQVAVLPAPAQGSRPSAFATPAGFSMSVEASTRLTGVPTGIGQDPVS